MFYPEAWRSSPRVAAMPPAARAGYFDLLCAIWLSEGCAIANDDNLLMACARLTPTEWKKHRQQILAMLRTLDDGRVTQDRLIEEYERTIDLRARRKSGGKKGARRRWQKDRSPNGSPIGSPNRSPNAKPMETETETETIGNTHSDECALPPARADFDPEPGLRRFEAEAKRLAPDRWQLHPAESAWVEVVTSPDIESSVFNGLQHWRGSKQWADGVFHRWDRWLRELQFTQQPRQFQAQQPRQTAAEQRRESGHAAIEEARARLASDPQRRQIHGKV